MDKVTSNYLVNLLLRVGLVFLGISIIYHCGQSRKQKSASMERSRPTWIEFHQPPSLLVCPISLRGSCPTSKLAGLVNNCGDPCEAFHASLAKWTKYTTPIHTSTRDRVRIAVETDAISVFHGQLHACKQTLDIAINTPTLSVYFSLMLWQKEAHLYGCRLA